MKTVVETFAGVDVPFPRDEEMNVRRVACPILNSLKVKFASLFFSWFVNSFVDLFVELFDRSFVHWFVHLFLESLV